MAPERVVQLITAHPGWYAYYLGHQGIPGRGLESNAGRSWWPIAAWALLEDATGQRRVVGVDMTGTGPSWSPPINPTSNLAEYVYSLVPLVSNTGEI